MTASLIESIPHGETAVYQTSPKRVPLWLPFAFLGLATVWCLYFWASDLLSETVLWIVYMLLLAACGFFLQVWLEAAAALVTGKRLLYDRGPAATLWGQQRILDLPFTVIADIRVKRSWLGNSFQLLLADGRPVELGWIAKPRDLIDAVSRASGVSVSDDR